MRSWIDNDNEYDKNIQKHFVQKFMQKQKKNTIGNLFNEIMEDA